MTKEITDEKVYGFGDDVCRDGLPFGGSSGGEAVYFTDGGAGLKLDPRAGAVGWGYVHLRASEGARPDGHPWHANLVDTPRVDYLGIVAAVDAFWRIVCTLCVLILIALRANFFVFIFT